MTDKEKLRKALTSFDYFVMNCILFRNKKGKLVRTNPKALKELKERLKKYKATAK